MLRTWLRYFRKWRVMTITHPQWNMHRLTSCEKKKKVESVKCYMNGSTEAAVAASGRLAFRWTAWEEELQQMSEKWSCFTTQLLSNGCSGWWENGAWLLASTLSSCPRTYIFSKIRLFSYKILSWSSSGGKNKCVFSMNCILWNKCSI